eukprot:Gb_04763 [translate_table: standard]
MDKAFCRGIIVVEVGFLCVAQREPPGSGGFNIILHMDLDGASRPLRTAVTWEEAVDLFSGLKRDLSVAPNLYNFTAGTTIYIIDIIEGIHNSLVDATTTRRLRAASYTLGDYHACSHSRDPYLIWVRQMLYSREESYCSRVIKIDNRRRQQCKYIAGYKETVKREMEFRFEKVNQEMANFSLQCSLVPLDHFATLDFEFVFRAYWLCNSQGIDKIKGAVVQTRVGQFSVEEAWLVECHGIRLHWWCVTGLRSPNPPDSHGDEPRCLAKLSRRYGNACAVQVKSNSYKEKAKREWDTAWKKYNLALLILSPITLQTWLEKPIYDIIIYPHGVYICSVFIVSAFDVHFQELASDINLSALLQLPLAMLWGSLHSSMLLYGQYLLFLGNPSEFDQPLLKNTPFEKGGSYLVSRVFGCFTHDTPRPLTKAGVRVNIHAYTLVVKSKEIAG